MGLSWCRMAVSLFLPPGPLPGLCFLLETWRYKWKPYCKLTVFDTAVTCAEVVAQSAYVRRMTPNHLFRQDAEAHGSSPLHRPLAISCWKKRCESPGLQMPWEPELVSPGFTFTRLVTDVLVAWCCGWFGVLFWIFVCFRFLTFPFDLVVHNDNLAQLNVCHSWMTRAA